MQDFVMEIKDRCGVENVVAGHLSFLSTHIFMPIFHSSLNEHILEIKT